MDKEAGLKDSLKKLWEKWWGKGQPESPVLGEDEIVFAFAEDLVTEVLWPITTSTLRQVVIEANKAGLPHEYLPYVFWILVENKNRWPRMHPKEKEALQIALQLVISQGEMPNYRPAMSLPPSEMEPAVDQVVGGLAKWALIHMGSHVAKGYSSLLSHWANRMARATGDTLPVGKAGMYLRLLFETYLREKPRHFLDGVLLERVIFNIVR